MTEFGRMIARSKKYQVSNCGPRQVSKRICASEQHSRRAEEIRRYRGHSLSACFFQPGTSEEMCTYELIPLAAQLFGREVLGQEPTRYALDCSHYIRNQAALGTH